MEKDEQSLLASMGLRLGLDRTDSALLKTRRTLVHHHPTAHRPRMGPLKRTSQQMFLHYRSWRKTALRGSSAADHRKFHVAEVVALGSRLWVLCCKSGLSDRCRYFGSSYYHFWRNLLLHAIELCLASWMWEEIQLTEPEYLSRLWCGEMCVLEEA
jgi:hypothetical protein